MKKTPSFSNEQSFTVDSFQIFCLSLSSVLDHGDVANENNYTDGSLSHFFYAGKRDALSSLHFLLDIDYRTIEIACSPSSLSSDELWYKKKFTSDSFEDIDLDALNKFLDDKTIPGGFAQ